MQFAPSCRVGYLDKVSLKPPPKFGLRWSVISQRRDIVEGSPSTSHRLKISRRFRMDGWMIIELYDGFNNLLIPQ